MCPACKTREADEDHTQSASFQSMFINFCKWICLLGLLSVITCGIIYNNVKNLLCSAVPLYQDYCLQALKDDLHRLENSFVSELLTPQSLQDMQAHLSPCCHSEATSPQLNPPKDTPSPPQPHPVMRVTPCSLWQDLDEVKASGLLSAMTTREIRLQEVW